MAFLKKFHSNRKVNHFRSITDFYKTRLEFGKMQREVFEIIKELFKICFKTEMYSLLS